MKIISRPNTKEFEENFDRIFGEKLPERIPPNPDEEDETFPQGPEGSNSSTHQPVKEK